MKVRYWTLEEMCLQLTGKTETIHYAFVDFPKKEESHGFPYIDHRIKVTGADRRENVLYWFDYSMGISSADPKNPRKPFSEKKIEELEKVMNYWKTKVEETFKEFTLIPDSEITDL